MSQENPFDFNVWEGLDEREVRLLRNCHNHAKDDPAGLPGHSLILLVSKLEEMILYPSNKYLRAAILKSLDNYSQEWDGNLDNLQLDLKGFINFLEEQSVTADD